MRSPDPFASILIGHMIGDYLLQNKWMAMNKSASHFKCAVHCLLYTLAVTATTFPLFIGLDPFIRFVLWPLWVFVSHFEIDRYGLADKWLKLIRGRSLEEFIEHGEEGIPTKLKQVANYHALRGAFTGLVYAAADNTMHLVLMYYAALALLSA